MRLSQKIIYSIASILSLIVIFTFRTVPSGKLWKKYCVLYVSSNVAERDVLSALSESGIDEVTSLSSQYLPVLLNKNSPEVSLFRLKTDDFYINKRNAFFFDKSRNYKLYYISQDFKLQLQKALSTLQQNKISCGIDSGGVYPFLIPLIIILFSALLASLSKNKPVFYIGAVYSILFSLCNPFYSAAVSLVLSELFIFILSNLWKREGFFNLLKHKKIFLILFVIIILNIITSSVSTVFLFLFYVTGLFASISLYSDYEISKLKNTRFQFINILPAKKIGFFNSKNFFILPVSVFVVFIFLAISVLSSSGIGNTTLQTGSKVILPAKAASKDKNLAQFDDFYKWNWQLKTKPYTSLNENSSNDSEKNQPDFIEFPYYETVENKIVKKTRRLNFDSDFCSNTYNQIDNLSFNAIEKVLKSEGEQSSFGYVSMNSYSINPLSTITIFICFLILLFIYIFSIIKRGGAR